MKKEKYWQDIWGYVSVLENSDELIAKKPTNERILELKGCKSIRRIKIDKAKEPIDLSILSGIEKLKEIDISSSEFINMKSLSVLDHLNSAFFDRCVVDFDDVLSLRNLEQLTLRRCKVKNIPVDLALDYLEWVTISECGIEDAYFIKNRKRLISIDVENNNISDFGFLKDMKRLRFLNVSDNPVEELGSVVSCRRLERLYMKEVGGLVLTPENIRMLPSGLAVHTDNGVIKVGLDGNEDKNNNTDCMEYKERKNNLRRGGVFLVHCCRQKS